MFFKNMWKKMEEFKLVNDFKADDVLLGSQFNMLKCLLIRRVKTAYKTGLLKLDFGTFMSQL